jgi:O-antigen ligase
MTDVLERKAEPVVNLKNNAIARTAEQATSSALLPNIGATYARRWGEVTEAALFWLLIAGLAWVPFWNGSNELIAWGLNAVLFAGVAFMYEGSLLIRGASHPVGIRNIALPAALFGLVLVWIYIQTIAWPYSWLSHPIWGMAADALGKPLEGSISVNRDLTNLALLRLVTAGLVFWVSLQLCRSASRARLLLYSVGLIGCGYAIYGLIALGSPAVRVPWFGDGASAGFVSSTFFNRNSFASYAGLCLVTIIGLSIALYQDEIRKRPSNRWSAVAALLEIIGRREGILFGAAFLLAVTLLLSGSRGGVSATALGLLVLPIFMYRGNGRAARAVLFVSAMTVGGALLLVFGDPVIAGLKERGMGDISRLAVYLITLRSALDTPFLGHGYGTFFDVFPMYRDRSISVDGIWSQAHNTYLELFQGLGLVFGSMLIVSVLLLIIRCLRGAVTRRDKTVPCVAIAAASLVGVHAIVDFGLQIQAVGLTFAAILGAGVAQSRSSRLALQD